MSRIPNLFFALLLSTLFAIPASAQVATGTLPFGSYSGGPDVINLANLNAHIAVPVFQRPGRGTNFNFSLAYDSSVWYPVGSTGSQTWEPALNWGWTTQTQVLTGTMSVFLEISQPCYTTVLGHTKQTGYYALYQNWVYTDPWGHRYPFNSTTKAGYGVCNGQNVQVVNANETANDGSGYTLTTSQAIGNGGVYYDIAYITSKNGNVSTPPINYASSVGYFADRNGNLITADNSGHFTDTLGTTALTVSGSGTPSSATKLTYTAPSGASPYYQMVYTAYTVQTKFGCSGVNEYGPQSANLVSEIDLPDGSKYSFTYEPTPGVQGNITGRLGSVTLPTGGTISYTYTGGASGIVCADGSAAGLHRYTPDSGANYWNYSRTQVSGSHWQTTVNDPTTPTANQTIIDFQGLYETKRVTYQGSSSGTLLQTINTCYNGAASPCTGAGIALPITHVSQLVAYPDNTGKVCEHDQFFNAYGLQTEQDDYDYGSGAPATTPLRKVITVYNTALTNGIVSMPSSMTTCNGTGTSSACTGPSGSSTGTVVAQITFAYDETTPITSSPVSPQWTSITGSRGNATTIKSLVQGSTFLTQTNSYYDTGNPYVATDVNGAQTSYSYSGSSCGNAFPTSVSEPLNMSGSMTWNCSGGVQLTVKDENSQTTTTSYTDPYFWRPASISFPDGGQTSWTYNSQTSTTSTTKMNSSQNIVTTQLLDGLGRNKEQQLTSDPEGVVYTDTTYDTLGRIYTVSNPYRSTSDPTYGLTTNGYDALSRATSVTLQDGSVSNVSYPNNTITATDPAGKTRTSTYDSLGRLTQVLEDPGSSPHLNFETDYGYDALGNVLCVAQKGTNTGTFSGCGSIPASWRPRTYAYDALSRLTSETNPESGTATYGYDASGHQGDLTSRVAPAPNQTGSSTVTSTFTYDLLHRLTQKSYSDGRTPTAAYLYDVSSTNGVTISNPIGRLVRATTNNCIQTINSYDTMGRATTQWLNTPSYCGPASFIPGYTYDLAGDITSFANGIGVTFSYANDTAARPTQITSSLVDSQHPATLVSGLSYMPASGYTAMTLGNGYLESRAYNPRLQPTEIRATNSTGFLRYDFTYGYGSSGSNNGNLMSWNSTGHDFTFSRSYSYDSLNRLSTLSSPSDPHGCNGLSWTYDAWGNRTDQTVTGGSCPTFHQSVNTQNRLSNSPYQYDAAGNMANDGAHTYFYDAENRLAQVDGTFGTCSTATACYQYDAFGRRVEKTTGSTTVDYIYDLAGKVTGEWLTEPGFTGQLAHYIYLNGQLVAEYKDSTTYFANLDHLGSSRLVSGPDGSGLQGWDYLPYGELLQGVFTTDHLFTGDERDSESNLDHTLFRKYSSNLGRWMTPDPAGLATVDPSNPQSWNRYAYVLNNPLSAVDPLGLQCVWDDGSFDSEDDPNTGSYAQCQAAGGTYFDPSTFQAPGGADWSADPNDDLAARTIDALGGIMPDTMVAVSSDPLSGGGNSSFSWLGAFGSDLFSWQSFGAAQIQAQDKGYYKCLAKKNLPGFSTAATAHVVGEAATITAEHNANLVAGAYYHFTDGRFTAWGKYSKVLVPEAAPAVKLWAKRLNAAGWAYADYELARSIDECSEKLQ